MSRQMFSLNMIGLKSIKETCDVPDEDGEGSFLTELFSKMSNHRLTYHNIPKYALSLEAQ